MCDRADGIYCGKPPFELTKEIRFEKDGDGMGPLPATGNATVMFQRDGKREREREREREGGVTVPWHISVRLQERRGTVMQMHSLLCRASEHLLVGCQKEICDDGVARGVHQL